jgi:hypothetical protein
MNVSAVADIDKHVPARIQLSQVPDDQNWIAATLSYCSDPDPSPLVSLAT